jgi:hypothetical protein
MKHEEQHQERQLAQDQHSRNDNEIKRIIIPRQEKQRAISSEPRIIAYADDILFYTGKAQELRQIIKQIKSQYLVTSENYNDNISSDSGY